MPNFCCHLSLDSKRWKEVTKTGNYLQKLQQPVSDGTTQLNEQYHQEANNCNDKPHHKNGIGN